MTIMSMNTSVIRDINVKRGTSRVRSNGERSSSYIGKKDITSDNKFTLFYKIIQLDSTISDGIHVCFVRKNEAQ